MPIFYTRRRTAAGCVAVCGGRRTSTEAPRPCDSRLAAAPRTPVGESEEDVPTRAFTPCVTSDRTTIGVRASAPASACLGAPVSQAGSEFGRLCLIANAGVSMSVRCSPLFGLRCDPSAAATSRS